MSDETVTPAQNNTEAAVPPVSQTDPGATPVPVTPVPVAQDPVTPAVTSPEVPVVDKTSAPPALPEFTFPEGVTPDAGILAEYKSFITEKGISIETAQELINFQAGLAKRNQVKFEQERQHNEEALKTHEILGGTNYDKNMALKDRVLTQFGDEGLKELVKSFDLSTDVSFMNFLVKIGNSIAEDTVINTGQSVPGVDLDKRPRQAIADGMFSGVLKDI